ncbi:TldD protein [Amycolatopsis tolypomycina]|uniref:TldD protein n=1 Tax=Amycolatopsis tolypomycina TaxID=208445 RepID=A0A1H4XZC6_9PSEU|nr:TldD/PmbA family protein [Amycolatopsis tolypomycina]SED11009.1 TldD protein [Amycolatopsis tolypomycina]
MLLTGGEPGVFRHAGLASGDYAEVRTERTRILDMVWRGGDVESVTLSRDEGRCARVVGAAGSSFVSSTEDSATELVRLAKANAAQIAVPAGAFAPARPGVSSDDVPGADVVESVPVEEKAALLGGYYDAALNAHANVAGALLYYREAVSDIDLVTSEGLALTWRRRDLTLQLTVYASAAGDRTAGSVSVGSGGDFSVLRKLDERIQAAAETAVGLARAPVVESGGYDVVCDGPLAGVWAHETIGHLCEADHHLGDAELQRALRPGRELGSPLLTITDGPGLPGARGYVPVDDEGTAGRPIHLLRDGVVAAARLHDRATAGAFRDEPTGNARSLGYRHPPLPRVRTIAIAAGDSSDADLVGGIGRGLLARGVLGGQTDRAGFTFLPAECREIRDGQVGRLVRGVVLSGGVLDAFRAVDGVGRDQWRGDTSAGCGKQGQYPLAVSSWAPSIRLRGIHVRTG